MKDLENRLKKELDTALKKIERKYLEEEDKSKSILPREEMNYPELENEEIIEDLKTGLETLK